MTRKTPFSIGRRWYCMDRGHGAFDFVIVGKSNKPGYKICNLEYYDQYWRDRNGPEVTKEREYSHAHIKRYATLKAEDK